MNFKTLKIRINLMTIIYSIVIVAISSTIMYNVVSDLISSRLGQENVEKLNRIQLSLENDINKLNSVSLLFTPYGNLGEAMLLFNQIQDVGEKGILMTKIKADMNVIEFSNPDINLCLFYVNDDYADFIATSSSVSDVDFQKLPVLYKTETNTYYGPHQTAKSLEKDLVISVKRNVNMGTNLPTFVYIECDFTNTFNAMKNYQDTPGYIHLLINEENRIAYSTNENKFELGTVFDKDHLYKTYEAASAQPWRLITLVDSTVIKSIEKELVYSYLKQYPIFLFAGIIFSLILVNVIARPMQLFQEGINQMEKGDFDSLIAKTNIYEFDTLINQIHKAKLRISMLLDEVREKEKKRAFAEVSRLRAQINPHFVLNTLNTIHWMALDQKQYALDKIVLSLTKILSYNLRNDHFQTTLGDELNATEEYLRLQQLKYDIDYQISNDLGEDVLAYDMPRFILQPLVENSIMHGKSKKIIIAIQIEIAERGLLLKLSDEGGKVNEMSLKSMHLHKEKPEKLGIGLSYVFSALSSYYHRNDLISFEDNGLGLVIRILLPFEGGMDYV